ncbi:MAG: P63C domain-containing protein [Burkholderiaceae bacterium]|nr:P63C domain-containing protein [Burkholderiaceae bacterium]
MNDRLKDKSKVNGGNARMNALSPDERREIARKGAAARWNPPTTEVPDEVRKALWGTPEKLLKIGEVQVECYVLDDKTRVLSGRGMQQAIGLGGEAKTHGGKLREFLSLSTIKPFVDNDLAMAVEHPVRFIRPGRGGVPAVAFEATLLIDLCHTILKAKDAPGFRKVWLPLAFQAQMVTLSFAKAGIISAIDEVTGYQEVREKDEIQKILDKYLTDYAKKWAKVFPDQFWEKLLRVKGYESYIGLPRPQFVGHWVNDIVYSRLAPGIRKRLQELNPKTEKGNRKFKNHQFLTDDQGVPELRELLSKAMALMDASTSPEEFDLLLRRALPKFGDTLELL